jgi:type I restriction enzyme S subunit
LSSKLAWGKISDIAEINPETTNAMWNGREILYIDIASVGNGVFNSEPQLMLYDEAPSRARRVVKHGDVLISTVRPNRRSMIQILNPAENTVASTGFALIRPKRIEDSDYLFGIICNKQFTLELEMLAYGAAYPAVSTDDICRPNVYLPEEKKRNTISRLLRPISKFNQSKLPEIMQEYISALFRSWFIDFDPVKAKAEGKLPHGMDEETAALFPDSFELSELGPIPAGWKLSSLGKIQFIKGKVPTVTDSAQKMPLVNMDYINTGIASEIDAENAVIVDSGEIIMLMDGENSGFVNQSPIQGALGSTFAKIRVENNKKDFVYHLLLNNEYWIRRNTTGTGIPHVDKEIVRRIQFAIPPSKILDKFNEIAQNSFEVLQIIKIKNKALSNTRDALLPRLMSGELEV